MVINVVSKANCAELIKRIHQTLSSNGYTLSRIPVKPEVFPNNDISIFEGLCEAILTRQASFASVVKILPALKNDLYQYNIGPVASMSDNTINHLYYKYKSGVQARFLKKELISIRDNAEVFQSIIKKHGSVRGFITSYLSGKYYNTSMNCYIQPNDEKLIDCFINPKSVFKLSEVALAICCEFFNNIGIDEFKPDGHTIRFLNRINLNKTLVRISRRPELVRKVGITISVTLGEPRKYVDSHIWCFCAEGEGEICTEDDPKCDLCQLKIQEPQLCQGFPNRGQIFHNPLAAAQRMKDCALTKKEVEKKMNRINLGQSTIQEVLSTVYGTGTRGLCKQKSEDISAVSKVLPNKHNLASASSNVIGKVTGQGKNHIYKAGPAQGKERLEIAILKKQEQLKLQWKKQLNILLVINHVQYRASLHFRNDETPWISSVLYDKNGQKVPLRIPLSNIGLKKNDDIHLRVEHNLKRITILQSSHHRLKRNSPLR